MRECGECQLCCELVSVPELNKPTNTKCIHQCEAGCGIYSERPDACRAFECLWIQGIIDDKPSETGMVCFAESMEGELGKLGLIVLKAVGKPHQPTIDWLFSQPPPVLLNDVWYVRGEKVKS
jgi:hypothetical protein